MPEQAVQFQSYPKTIRQVSMLYQVNQAQLPNVTLPEIQLGFFCKFEDQINRNRKFRIDFGTD